jgi:hypothetical protein
MSRSSIISACIAMIAAVSSDTLLAQGTFQNLDFEEATVPLSSFGDYSVASALPDWSVYYGTAQQTEVLVNATPLDAPTVTLWTSDAPIIGGIIDGNFSAFMLGGDTPNTQGVSISQTGLIPDGTRSLFFKAEGGGQLDVELGSQPVFFTAVGSGPNYTLYGANISAWAGQTAQLTFTVPGAPHQPSMESGWEIDDISFSPISVVPEASPLVLTGFGALLFGVYNRLRSKAR